MDFEWNEVKRMENLRKHGLDFLDAPTLFGGPMLTRADTRDDYGESRWIGIGILESVCVIVAFTERSDGEVIRIISMRKALSHERKAFEKTIQDKLA
mgnify:CR=1 FL=1|jgi:uncharacterized protein